MYDTYNEGTYFIDIAICITKDCDVKRNKYKQILGYLHATCSYNCIRFENRFYNVIFTTFAIKFISLAIAAWLSTLSLNNTLAVVILQLIHFL